MTIFCERAIKFQSQFAVFPFKKKTTKLIERAQLYNTIIYYGLKNKLRF